MLHEFRQGAQTTIILGVIFAGRAVKLEKLGQRFQVPIHLHPQQQRAGKSFSACLNVRDLKIEVWSFYRKRQTAMLTISR